MAVNPLTYLVAIVFSVWLVNVLGESDLTIFVLAAFPIVGLTALSKSPIGEEVQKSLEAELPGSLSSMQQPDPWSAPAKTFTELALPNSLFPNLLSLLNSHSSLSYALRPATVSISSGSYTQADDLPHPTHMFAILNAVYLL